MHGGVNPSPRQNHSCEAPVQDAVKIELEPKKDLVYCAARRVLSLNYTLRHVFIPDLIHPDFTFLVSPGSTPPSFMWGGPSSPSPYGGYGGGPSSPSPFGGHRGGATNSPFGGYWGGPSSPSPYGGLWGASSPGPFGMYGGMPHNSHSKIDCSSYTFPGLSDDQILQEAETAVRDGKQYLSNTWQQQVDAVMQCVNSKSGQSAISPTADAMHVQHLYSNMTLVLNRFADQLDRAVQAGMY